MPEKQAAEIRVSLLDDDGKVACRLTVDPSTTVLDVLDAVFTTLHPGKQGIVTPTMLVRDLVTLEEPRFTIDVLTKDEPPPGAVLTVSWAHGKPHTELTTSARKPRDGLEKPDTAALWRKALGLSVGTRYEPDGRSGDGGRTYGYRPVGTTAGESASLVSEDVLFPTEREALIAGIRIREGAGR
jgi:hypothetical protein